MKALSSERTRFNFVPSSSTIRIYFFFNDREKGILEFLR